MEGIVREFKSDEQTMVISTHAVGDTEQLFDAVVFLDEGTISLKAMPRICVGSMASPSMIYLRRFSPNGKLFPLVRKDLEASRWPVGILCIDCGIYAVDPVSVSANWII